MEETPSPIQSAILEEREDGQAGGEGETHNIEEESCSSLSSTNSDGPEDPSTTPQQNRHNNSEKRKSAQHSLSPETKRKNKPRNTPRDKSDKEKEKGSPTTERKPQDLNKAFRKPRPLQTLQEKPSNQTPQLQTPPIPSQLPYDETAEELDCKLAKEEEPTSLRTSKGGFFVLPVGYATLSTAIYISRVQTILSGEKPTASTVPPTPMPNSAIKENKSHLELRMSRLASNESLGGGNRMFLVADHI